jgi:excisionase family DNA binding protein
MEEILTVQEVANYLRISRSTIWRWCSEGKLPAFKVGRSWRIRRTIVENLVDEQSTEQELTRPYLTENADASL